MDDALLGVVLERLADKPLPSQAEDLLLAALDSDQELAAQLDAPLAQRYPRVTGSIAEKEPVGAYLRSVTVAGFRGIGPSATLEVAPGPGLTLVVGRNGSGKSSFAEALEVLLTGTLLRWMPPAPVVVRNGWRSKHAIAETSIQAEFFIEGSGRATAGRAWAGGTELFDSTSWLQRAGEKRVALSELGWNADLKEYRPFLSHAELEAFFGRPSELHDLLASVLGLEDLTAADKRLNAVRKEREDALSDVKKHLEGLRALLRPLAEGDERAKTCLTALAGTTPAKWDIKVAETTATGGAGEPAVESELAALRNLAHLSPPSATEVTKVIDALRDASAGLRDVAGSSAAEARDLAGLLDTALAHHQAHGDGDCPVCGNANALTAEWRAAAERKRDQLQAQAAAANEAFTAAKSAASRTRALMSPVPLTLSMKVPGLDAILDRASVIAAWREWSAPVAGDEPATAQSFTAPEAVEALAQRMEATFPVLARALTNLNEAAAKEVARRDGNWSPVAAAIAAWCKDAKKVIAENEVVPALRQARKWLADASADLRDERLAPLAEKSRAIWDQLRQESSVDLGAFRLAGTNTQRRLDLDVSIDGQPGAALGVMSQGEINALALSIFLPRATMPDSPFNFLVIDDPVQAMDPAKVDGLAKVLSTVAKERQVIVFTHDSRLAAAIRDLSIPATILEVTRQPKSRVTVRKCLNASKQALKDASDVSKDPDVPAEVLGRVVPGLCRTAVEAAFTEAFWRRQLRAGQTRAEIEAVTEGKKRTLANVAALALFGNADDGQKAAQEVEKLWGKTLARTLRNLNKGTHDGYQGDLDLLISDSRSLVSKIDEALK
jgi:recombinational DNA repair ATPase RecF